MERPTADRFLFVNCEWDPATQAAHLHYATELDGVRTTFTETWTFAHKAIEYNEQALARALQALWVMCGVSYYKATLAPEIVFEDAAMTPPNISFFEETWRHGLGEFFYQNKLPLPARLPFLGNAASVPNPIKLPHQHGTVVPLGGGKDSLTTCGILKDAGEDYTTWTVGHSELLHAQIQTLGTPHWSVQRSIAPALLELNKAGAWNGHVPLSAMLGAAGVVSAVLSGKRYVALSNESSASHGNVEYCGVEINHQYSKSLAFERALQHYVHTYISPDITYFSLLRPWSEYRIAQQFFTHYEADFADAWSSCNRNFTLKNENPLTWCGDCSKCAFVACLMAEHRSPEYMANLFGGDIFTKKSLQDDFAGLMGKTEVKPFECVGEADEVCFSLQHAKARHKGIHTWEIPDIAFNPKAFTDHALPDHFQSIMKKII